MSKQRSVKHEPHKSHELILTSLSKHAAGEVETWEASKRRNRLKDFRAQGFVGKSADQKIASVDVLALTHSRHRRQSETLGRGGGLEGRAAAAAKEGPLQRNSCNHHRDLLIYPCFVGLFLSKGKEGWRLAVSYTYVFI